MILVLAKVARSGPHYAHRESILPLPGSAAERCVEFDCVFSVDRTRLITFDLNALSAGSSRTADWGLMRTFEHRTALRFVVVVLSLVLWCDGYVKSAAQFAIRGEPVAAQRFT